MKFSNLILLISVFSILLLSSCNRANTANYDNNVSIEAIHKTESGVQPRIVVMTSGETDDRSSMVHFLLYTNEVQTDAIIMANSCFSLTGHSEENWIEDYINAYEKVYPNLRVHDSRYPDPEYLKSVSFVGDINPDHIVVSGYATERLPGEEPVIDPSEWEDTPGSDRIAEILLENDPRPVYIATWGGMNTALIAFEKIKREHPSEYERAVSKAVIYCSWYQDGAGNYIEKYHPLVTILLNHHFNGSWDYGALTNSDSFVSRYLLNKDNPLGMLYSQTYISEGDTPSFLHVAENGLRSYEDPAYGGWGGRFYKVRGFDRVYRDTGFSDLREWFEPAMHDFQARLIWCTTNQYKDANHKPIISCPEGTDITVHSKDTVHLSITVTDNDAPDIETIWDLKQENLQMFGLTHESFVKMAENPASIASMARCDIFWSQHMAGTYQSNIDIIYNRDASISFIAPTVTHKQTVHIIAEAVDKGYPRLTSYARFIITIEP